MSKVVINEAVFSEAMIGRGSEWVRQCLGEVASEMSESRSHWKMQRKRAKDREGCSSQSRYRDSLYSRAQSAEAIGNCFMLSLFVSRPGSLCCRVLTRVRKLRKNSVR